MNKKIKYALALKKQAKLGDKYKLAYNYRFKKYEVMYNKAHDFIQCMFKGINADKMYSNKYNDFIIVTGYKSRIKESKTFSNIEKKKFKSGIIAYANFNNIK